MIELSYSEGAFSLRVRGHAGYAPRGQDIVCAAVSALCAALEAALSEREEYRAEIKRRAGAAEFSVRCDPEAEAAESCRALMRAAALGIGQISRSYPQCVKCSMEAERND